MQEHSQALLLAHSSALSSLACAYVPSPNSLLAHLQALLLAIHHRHEQLVLEDVGARLLHGHVNNETLLYLQVSLAFASITI